MLSKRERQLITILLWVIMACGFGVVTFLQVLRSSETTHRIEALEQRISRLSAPSASEPALIERAQRLGAELEGERSRFYPPDAMNPYRFGTLIQKLLDTHRLSTNRYQTIEAGGVTLLEFSVRGDALAFMNFLRDLSQSEKYRVMPYLAMDAQAGKGEIAAVFRVRYEVLDDAVR